MPAPPYSGGTATPSKPSFVIPPSTRSRSNRCWRSFSRIYGATSRAAHSRTDCSSRRCSSVRDRSIIEFEDLRISGFEDLVARSSDSQILRSLDSYFAASCYHDAHGRAAAQIEQRGGACAVGGDLELVGAAKERAELARSRVSVGGNHLRYLMPADLDLHPLALGAHDRVERAAIDVRDQIPETIDAKHLAEHGARPGFDRRLRHLEPVQGTGAPAERAKINAFRQPRGGRRKPIAALERAADRRPRVSSLAQLDDAFRRVAVQDQAEHAVIGRDKFIIANVDGNPAPRGPDAGIDD